MEPATNKLSREMFETFRSGELERFTRRLQELNKEAEHRIGESDGEYVRKLFKGRDELVELKKT